MEKQDSTITSDSRRRCPKGHLIRPIHKKHCASCSLLRRYKERRALGLPYWVAQCRTIRGHLANEAYKNAWRKNHPVQRAAASLRCYYRNKELYGSGEIHKNYKARIKWREAKYGRCKILFDKPPVHITTNGALYVNAENILHSRAGQEVIMAMDSIKTPKKKKKKTRQTKRKVI